VRLHPEFVRPVLGIRTEDLAGIDIEPDRDVRFDALRCLAENTADQAAVGRALLDWVRRHEPEAPTDCALEAARRIRSSGGRLPIRRLADAVGASERSLRRAFRQELGIGAKAYARSVRMKNLLLTSDQIAEPDWADLALESGFSDQSHMLREIRSMTGYSASAIHAMRRGNAGPPP
jgi:AraC-like DNA-binding protein